MSFRVTLPYLVILFCFNGNVIAQPWSGILSPARAINWSNAGLPASLPDGETTANPWTPPTRTQCGSTISSGASPATINAALAVCSAGTYVLLGLGTFTFNNANLTLYAQNGVTLRGSGGSATLIYLSGTAQVKFGNIVSAGTATWSGGSPPGTTSITLTGVSGPTITAGTLLHLQQCDTGLSGRYLRDGNQRSGQRRHIRLRRRLSRVLSAEQRRV